MRILSENKFQLPCLAGNRLLIIDDVGEVKPCEMLEYSMGNLREENYNINNILSSSKTERIKEFIKKTKCFCTFECAILDNIIFNWHMYPKILMNL